MRRLLALAALLVPPATATAQDKPAPEGGFAEARMGDVPDGAAELMTPEVDKAIDAGLAWLAQQQNADGSFGSGAYRGNVAVTSLAGIAFMANGSAPGRGPYGAQIDRALQFVMDCTGPSRLHQRPRRRHPRPDVLARLRRPVPGRGLRHGPPPRAPREARARHPPDHRRPERRGRLALPARPPRRRPLGDDLPDQRPPRRPQRRHLRPPRDGRGLHPLRQEVAEPRRRLHLHAHRRRQRLPPLGRRSRRPLQRRRLRLQRGRRRHQLLEAIPPEIKFGPRYSHYFYGHYYAAQAFWIRGGEDWLRWYPAIRDELVSKRTKLGYWPDSIGNEYGTAMALIILQMPNNVLPIFQR